MKVNKGYINIYYTVGSSPIVRFDVGAEDMIHGDRLDMVEEKRHRTGCLCGGVMGLTQAGRCESHTPRPS